MRYTPVIINNIPGRVFWRTVKNLSSFELIYLYLRRPPSEREELRGSHLDVGLQLDSTARHPPDLSNCDLLWWWWYEWGESGEGWNIICSFSGLLRVSWALTHTYELSLLPSIQHRPFHHLCHYSSRPSVFSQSKLLLSVILFHQVIPANLVNLLELVIMANLVITEIIYSLSENISFFGRLKQV